MTVILKAGFVIAGLFVGIALGRDIGAVAITKITASQAASTTSAA